MAKPKTGRIQAAGNVLLDQGDAGRATRVMSEGLGRI